jgi:hypothetical protein
MGSRRDCTRILELPGFRVVTMEEGVRRPIDDSDPTAWACCGTRAVAAADAPGTWIESRSDVG